MVSKESYLVEVIQYKATLFTVLPTKTTKVIEDRHLRSNLSGHVYCQFQILKQVVNVWSPHLTFDHYLVEINFLDKSFDLNFDYFMIKSH